MVGGGAGTGGGAAAAAAPGNSGGGDAAVAAPAATLFTVGQLIDAGLLCASQYARYSDVGLLVPAGAEPAAGWGPPSIQILYPNKAMSDALDASSETIMGPVVLFKPAGAAFAPGRPATVRIPFEFETATRSNGFLMDDNTSMLNLTVRHYHPATATWRILPSAPPLKTGPFADRTMLLLGRVDALPAGGLLAVIATQRPDTHTNCIYYDVFCFLALLFGAVMVGVVIWIVLVTLIFPTLWPPDNKEVLLGASLIYSEVDPFSVGDDDPQNF